MSLLSTVAMAPRDPILGVTEQFAADPNPNKVNLGVGVYYDDDGKLPLLACVAEAERRMASSRRPAATCPSTASPATTRRCRSSSSAPTAPAVDEGRIATVQGLGGTGGLKVGADFLKSCVPTPRCSSAIRAGRTTARCSTSAGFVVETYPYYDAATHGVDFDGMLAALEAAPAGTIVVLHACCHNPTGYDLEPGQWSRVVRTVAERGLVAFLDMAYQGFGDGIEEDGAVVRQFLGQPASTSSSPTSFSKSFSLYGERVGALSVVCAEREEAARVLQPAEERHPHQLLEPADARRAAWSPTVLTTPALRALWEEELAGMRDRIKRDARRAAARSSPPPASTRDMGFITRQRGMFSYSGLDAGADAAAARASSASTASTPAASAWRR